MWKNITNIDFLPSITHYYNFSYNVVESSTKVRNSSKSEKLKVKSIITFLNFFLASIYGFDPTD